jgi:hypothetical protein
MVDYEKEIDEILEKNLTEQAFSFWLAVKKKIPNIGKRLSSSTKKYHKKENGDNQRLEEHVYEMLKGGAKIYRLFGDDIKSPHKDAVLLSIVLHDSLKYGPKGDSTHTLRNHDSLGGDIISKNKDTFLRFLSENEFNILEESIRFHSGRWSTEAKKDFNFKDYRLETFFLHMLDMLSSNDCLKG